jgi:hypothetical protein
MQYLGTPVYAEIVPRYPPEVWGNAIERLYTNSNK